MQTGGRTFKHLTKNDRLRIEKWQRRGLKPPQIAEKLRVHVSTIYRELKRGEYERLDGETWEMVTAYSRTLRRRDTKAICGRKGRT